MTNKIDTLANTLKQLYDILQKNNYSIIDTLDDYTNVFLPLNAVGIDVQFNDNDLTIKLQFDDNYNFYLTFTKNKNVFVYKQLNIYCY